MVTNKIYNMDCVTFLKSLPDNCIDCCVTSPPYWGLRDYGVEGQLGLENTPVEFVAKMVEVFEEVRRVLKPEGTCWVNLGDSYAAGAKNRNEDQARANSTLCGGLSGQSQVLKQQNKVVSGLKPKDLVGIPWRVAFSLQDAGWWLRQDIIWAKPNPMPESVQDRCTKSHEYIFMITKSAKYYYDAAAIRTERKTDISEQKYAWGRAIDGSVNDARVGSGTKIRKDKQRGHSRKHAGFNDRWDNMTKEEQAANGANKRSVWTVPTKPFAEAHFATYPVELITDCIKAGCPEGGIVLDPFMGAGTTALAALMQGRRYIGSELNPEYIRIAESRLFSVIQFA